MSVVAKKSAKTTEPSLVEQLQGRLNELLELQNEATKVFNRSSSLASEWTKRVRGAEYMMALATTSEAFASAKKLRNQAKAFAVAAITQKDGHNLHQKKIFDHANQLREAIASVKLSEQRSKLEGSLRRIASKNGVVFDNMDDTYDEREIKLLLHTAEALVELKGSE